MSGLLAVSTPYTVPAGLMDVLQAVLLVLVAAGALPALLLLTLGRIRRREK